MSASLTPPAPARLHAFLARDVPHAIILRRGPSDWVQSVLWHTDSDQFEPGQWFHGSINPYWGADLSPNGRLFVYMARKFNRRTLADAEYTSAWTAISRPPYLTALALWPEAVQRGEGGPFKYANGGGGFFRDDNTVVLYRSSLIHHPDHPPVGVTVELSTDLSLQPWLERLTRNGWELIHEGFQHPATATTPTYRTPNILQRSGPQLAQRLVLMRQRFQPPVYQLHDSTHNGSRLLAAATWADWDQGGRLVWAAAGRLYAAPDGDPDHAEVLADFNAHLPEACIAPDWARQW